jgi:hypothetical protein
MYSLLTPPQTLRIDRVGETLCIPVSQATRLTIQTTNPPGKSWSKAVITVKRSLSGLADDAQALDPAATITATGILTLDVADTAFIHLTVTTAEGSTSEVLVSTYQHDCGA